MRIAKGTPPRGTNCVGSVGSSTMSPNAFVASDREIERAFRLASSGAVCLPPLAQPELKRSAKLMRTHSEVNIMNPTIRFKTWGKGFSGCDGGNLHGSVWFCGIEWGAGKEHDLEQELNDSVSDPPQTYEAPEDIVRDRDSGTPYPFGVKLAKLIAAMRGMAVCDYHRVIHEMPFPFHRRSDFFKLNLYPVAFRKVDAQLWVDKYKNATGLSTREEYLDWCRRNRFPEMRLWLERGRPKLIVGIGNYIQERFLRRIWLHRSCTPRSHQRCKPYVVENQW